MATMFKMKTHRLLTEESVGANASAYTVSVGLDTIANQDVFSAMLEVSGADATYNVAYEISPNNKDWVTPSSASNVFSSASTGYATFVVTGVVTGSTTTTVSGSHGIDGTTTVRFSGFDQDQEWQNIMHNSVYTVTSGSADTLTLTLDTSSLDAYDTTTSGQCIPVAIDYLSFTPVLAPWIRFKATETAGNAGNVTFAVTIQ